MAQYIGLYHKLMVRLGETQNDAARISIEPQLREYGGQMVSFAELFVKKEKSAVDRMLVLAKRVPFYYLTASMLIEGSSRLDEEEKLEMVQDIISETERSQRIVRNLLDFPRESETQVRPLAIEKIVEDSIRLVANQLKLAKVRLETDFAADLPSVHGDEQMLKQVFVNLILNALDALRPKGAIWISTHKDTSEGYVAVEVKDNGPGIPEHVLTRIFDYSAAARDQQGRRRREANL